MARPVSTAPFQGGLDTMPEKPDPYRPVRWGFMANVTGNYFVHSGLFFLNQWQVEGSKGQARVLGAGAHGHPVLSHAQLRPPCPPTFHLKALMDTLGLGNTGGEHADQDLNPTKFINLRKGR